MTSFPIGRLNGVQAEPGTILGPDSSRQWMVVVQQDDAGVVCSYAGVKDLEAARDRLAGGQAPRSMAERILAIQAGPAPGYALVPLVSWLAEPWRVAA